MSPRALTPPGRGGVAVLELVGDAEAAALAALARDRFDPTALAPGAAPRLLRLADGDLDLDEALVLRRPDGALELHLHGSPVLVARLGELLGGAGPADRDLGRTSLEDRARALLATAPCEAAARCLLDQAEGALTRALDDLERRAAAGDLEGACGEVAGLAAASRCRRYLFEPARVVLAGPTNAGKSTLFNALAGARRVVVSGEAGTTRDRVEARVLVGAYAVDLVDTAGERAADGPAAAVEARGQAAGRAERDAADLVLWLDPDPAGGPPPALGGPDGSADSGDPAPSCGPPTLHLLGRADELPPGAAPPGALAVAPGVDPLAAAAAVSSALLDALDLFPEPWTPGRPLAVDEVGREGLARLAAAPDRAAWSAALAELRGAHG